MASCVNGVWLGCTNVVHTTVREDATPDSKENKQAHAGIRLFSQAFSTARCCGACRTHGLLRGGVGEKHRATPQGAIVNV